MHLNHFFLRALAQQLDSVLRGARLEEAFSQEREELILLFRLADGGTEWYMRAFLRAELSYLSFPTDFHRARANTATLFEEAYGLAVLVVAVVPFDRSLLFTLQNGYQLLFKLHGNRANVALLEKGAVIKLFKNNLTADKDLTLDGLAQHPILTRQAFDAIEGNAYKLLPQIGTETRAWLDEQGYVSRTPDEGWAIFEGTFERLKDLSAFYLTLWQGKTQLTLFPAGQIEDTFPDPIAAAQAFARVIGYRFYTENAKREAATTLAKRREQTLHYLEKMRARRKALEEGRSPQEIADLVLAQMHLFAKATHAQTVQIDDFYRGGQVEIKLKEGQTPQAIAEQLYRKAKNAGQELVHLQEQESARLAWLERLETAAQDIEAMDDVRAIRKTLAAMGPALASKADEETLPYRAVFYKGWEMRIGKNAQANDTMLRQHSRKDDLWFHAKDVAGSHVLLCHRPGQPYPKDIIEAAAALAAYHSKKRTEGLADVVLTERKYVRKVKGTPAGAVRVERERVLLVEPKGM